MNSTPISVQHNVEQSRYEIVIDGRLAVAEYTLEPIGAHAEAKDAPRDPGVVITFTHTFVPPEMRGMGVAEKLVRKALADAREKNYRVVPQCSYVAKFIERYKEYADLLANRGN